MTCYRSRDNWHSYVKHSLSDSEIDEMASHLAHCSECRDVVSVIQKTLADLAKSRQIISPSAAIKINVMMSIDKNRYIKQAGINSSHLFELKNWGLSMIAAGILLFTLNLTSLNPNFQTGQITEWPSELSKQMAIPFDKLSKAANQALGKIESLTLSKPK